MKNFVIGTSGHIDHGKTTLIRALTGIDTDTTREEKQRGLSINLGFAYLDLPSGERVGIVDVPGHEKFIKNMLAGVAGIDLVLMVIDVNEGIMPQTREHAAILELLGVKDYIIVLTKVGQADPDLISIVEEDIKEQFKGTALEGADIVRTDAVEGIGLDELLDLIDQARSDSVYSQKELPGRLNIDRAFSVKGVGTVVTGTLLDGPLEVGEDITIYPAGIKSKIRNIQIHEADQVKAHAGNRTAINLTKVRLEDVKRGDVLTAGHLDLSYMLDVRLTCLKSQTQAIELWDRLHVHIGTREVLARVVPIGVDRIRPGQSELAQLRLEEVVAVKKDDRFIVRAYSPVITIGGGVVLDPKPKKHKRYNEEVIESLELKETGETSDILLDFLSRRTHGLTSTKDMADYLNLPLKDVKKMVSEMVDKGELVAVGALYLSEETLDKMTRSMTETLANFHQTHPLQPGMPLGEFRSQFKKIDPRDVDAILKILQDREQVVISAELIRLSSFNVDYSPEQKAVHEAMSKEMQKAGMTPPSIEELIQDDPIRKAVYDRMLGKELIQVDRRIVLDHRVYEEALNKVKAYINQNGAITLGEFRDMMGTSRKYGIAFLEHLDRLGVTKRIEDKRVLR
ncbi:selenocysteine-specific translation elongation factor [Atopobacter sp. AH10]|uniref:selenocysteine-specific translation elongation factor n=1 Tax=Atopobacter sp. AH10 TaxID=2315861 RepID=UPI000EF18BCA|nr:selenocysteine-specific translation elongation factor [Atopobacter sp. AH10]RLK64112.1 selenocysteine-specific translation elongation factor [Atopobacter sp. AH10]